MLVWWPRLCSLVVSCQSEWFHVLNLLLHVYNEISACTWWLFTVSVVYRCFRQKSHLIKCVSYAYVAPMLHQLVGEKARRDTIKSIANMGTCRATVRGEAVCCQLMTILFCQQTTPDSVIAFAWQWHHGELNLVTFCLLDFSAGCSALISYQWRFFILLHVSGGKPKKS